MVALVADAEHSGQAGTHCLLCSIYHFPHRTGLPCRKSQSAVLANAQYTFLTTVMINCICISIPEMKQDVTADTLLQYNNPLLFQVDLYLETKGGIKRIQILKP